MTSASGTPAQVWSLGRDGSGHVTHVDAVDTGGAPTASTLRRYSAFGVPREAAPAQSIERGISASPSLYQLVEIWISVDERQRFLRADVREFSIAR